MVTSDIALPYSKYGDTPATVRFYDRLREKIQAQPGVQVAVITRDVRMPQLRASVRLAAVARIALPSRV